jgi:hypothetical protein
MDDIKDVVVDMEDLKKKKREQEEEILKQFI